nr:Protein C09H10.9 [Haemonchus contortus]
MKSESVHTPYVEAVLEQGSISVWRMPAAVSQSRLGGRNAPSNACTVIAVRMAEIIHRTDTKMPSFFKTKTSTKSLRAAAGHEEMNDSIHNETLTAVCNLGNSGQATNACPARVISCFTNAIIDGNTLHEEAVRQRVNGEQNFTIPDAIKACKNSVMVGAVIATGHMDNIGDLCQWLSLNIFHESQSPRDHTRECEISLIRFCGKTLNSDCCLPTTSLPCEFPVFATAKRRRKRRLDTKSTLKVLKYAKTENDCNEGAEDYKLDCTL